MTRRLEFAVAVSLTLLGPACMGPGSDVIGQTSTTEPTATTGTTAMIETTDPIATTETTVQTQEASPPVGLGDPVVPSAGNIGYDTVRYQWDLMIDPLDGTLEAATVMEAIATASASRFSLDFSGPAPTRVAFDGQEAEFELQPPKLWILHPIEPGDDFIVEIDFEGRPSPHSPPGFFTQLGWIHEGETIYSAAVLPGDTATWIPLNDTPLDPALFSVRISTPPRIGAVASGTPIEAEGSIQWETPIPITEFGFAVGRLEQRSPADDSIPAIVFTALGDTPLPSDLWDQRLIEMVRFLEGFLGPFPFPTVGLTLVDGLPGGNSTPGQIFVGAFREELIAHELAHQWIGGSVGTATSRDTWLREGIPEYLAHAWLADRNGTELEDRMRSLHSRLGSKTRALLDVDEPSDRSDDATYSRGALAFHALRRAVGDETFILGLKSFASEHAGTSASTEDFLGVVQQHTAIDIQELMTPWIDREAMPPLP